MNNHQTIKTIRNELASAKRAYNAAVDSAEELLQLGRVIALEGLLVRLGAMSADEMTAVTA